VKDTFAKDPEKKIEKAYEKMGNSIGGAIGSSLGRKPGAIAGGWLDGKWGTLKASSEMEKMKATKDMDPLSRGLMNNLLR
jgi:hypothetical protein